VIAALAEKAIAERLRGSEVRVLARLDGNPVLVRQGLHLAGTFHPELTADTRVHRYFCQMVATTKPSVVSRK